MLKCFSVFPFYLLATSGSGSSSQNTFSQFIGMPESIVVELIKILPSLFWCLFTIALLIVFYKPIKEELIPYLSELKVLGVEFTFVREKLNKAIEKQNAIVSSNDRLQVLRRAAKASTFLRGMQVLWVDDHPENNIDEIRLFRKFGINVDQVQTSQQAIIMLEREKYDAIVSDIERGAEQDAGIRFLSEIWTRKLYRWTILYTGAVIRELGTPAYAFGITSRPDHLLHYLIDIAERERL